MKPILFLTILCISLFHAKNTYSTGVQALDNAPGIGDALSVKDRAVFKANCLLNCRSSKCTDPYRATACAQLCNKCSDVLPTRALEAINGFDLISHANAVKGSNFVRHFAQAIIIAKNQNSQ